MLIKIVGVADVVLLPDLVDDMVEKVLVVPFPLVFEQKLCSVDSLLILLSNKYSEQDLGDKISRHVVYLFSFIGFLINDNSPLCVLHELVEWLGVVIVRLLLVH